jgi:tubulin polyglutamylase TTLL9
VAININSPNYVKKIGGKWFLNDIKLFMMSKYGIDNQAFSGVQKAIIKSLIAVQKLVTNDKRSFELYGYDFLFDAKMKPWLL